MVNSMSSDPANRKPSSPSPQRPRFVLWLMLVLLAWAAVVAVGTMLYRFHLGGVRTDDTESLEVIRAWRRGLLVLSTMALFLTVWVLALFGRHKRASRNAPH